MGIFSPPGHTALDSPGVALAPVVVGVRTTWVGGIIAGGMSGGGGGSGVTSGAAPGIGSLSSASSSDMGDIGWEAVVGVCRGIEDGTRKHSDFFTRYDVQRNCWPANFLMSHRGPSIEVTRYRSRPLVLLPFFYRYMRSPTAIAGLGGFWESGALDFSL